VLEQCGAQNHLEATLPYAPVELLVLAVRHGGIGSADGQERVAPVRAALHAADRMVVRDAVRAVAATDAEA
jgi:hypothetical protein